MQLVATLLAGFGGVLTNAFLITLTVVFILLEASGFPAKLRAATKDPKASLPAFEEFTHAVKGYLAIKTAVSLATGLSAALWVAVLGLDFPLLWGLLAFLFNYVPTIGSILAAVPAVLLALIQLGPFSRPAGGRRAICASTLHLRQSDRTALHGSRPGSVDAGGLSFRWSSGAGSWGRSACCWRCHSP